MLFRSLSYMEPDPGLIPTVEYWPKCKSPVVEMVWSVGSELVGFHFLNRHRFFFLEKGNQYSRSDISAYNMEKTTFAMQRYLLQETRGGAERMWSLTSLD